MATAHAERLPKERLVPHLLAKITSSLQRTLWIKAMKKREQKEKEEEGSRQKEVHWRITVRVPSL